MKFATRGPKTFSVIEQSAALVLLFVWRQAREIKTLAELQDWTFLDRDPACFVQRNLILRPVFELAVWVLAVRGDPGGTEGMVSDASLDADARAAADHYLTFTRLK